MGDLVMAGKRNAAGPRIGEEAVRASTGKSWAEWFGLLDAAGAATMDHRAIVAWLVENHEVGGWWRQMVAVSYEQARGLRAVHEKPDGYEISVSRTVAVDAATLFAAWTDGRMRRGWLPDAAISFRAQVPGKSLRFAWIDGKSDVHATFQSKGAGKCAVNVQQRKLPSAAAAKRMKSHWAAALDALKQQLEG
jgi:uncharacterized protein YndB with AHSA1/START domain